MLLNLMMAGIGMVLVAGGVYAARAGGLVRTRQVRALAGRMGWGFRARPSLELIPERERFGLFTVRTHHRARNHLFGEVGGVQVSVFDLEYVRGGADRPQGSEQTVVHVHAPRLDLPAFSVRPETVRHRLGDHVGGDDIDLDKDAKFSHAFLLRGADEDAVRDLFGARVRDVFHRHPGTSADAHGSDILFWRRGHVAATAEIPALVQAALDLAAQLGRASRKAARV
jgi:carbonic anhydrase